jgi:hypothetical protein
LPILETMASKTRVRTSELNLLTSIPRILPNVPREEIEAAIQGISDIRSGRLCWQLP